MKSTNMFVVCGGARTFLSCVDNLFHNVIFSLFGQNTNTHVLFYLKLTDPGPKNQEGWNFSYNDLDEDEVNRKIDSFKNYPNLTIHKHILHTSEITDDDLWLQVKDRSKYNVFLIDDKFFLRALHCHYNIEQCGKIIEKIEYDYCIQFDNFVYVRPDLIFNQRSIELTEPMENVIICTGINHYANDHFAAIPRSKFKNFFFDRMHTIRTNEEIYFESAETIYWHTIKPYQIITLCPYDIKRG